MEDTKLELELSYVGNVSQLLSKQTLNDMEWNQGKIAVTTEDMWLPSGNNWDTIPLRSIELVDRLLKSSVATHIQQTTGYSRTLTVDYKKQSMFSDAYITSTILFAGRDEDIRKLKNYILSVLGFKFDATFGKLSSEESRLICLLAVGMNDINALLPIFDCNETLLNHAFVVLEKRGLVDEYAAPTTLGQEYVNLIKGGDQGRLGSDVRKSFENVAKTWEHVDVYRSVRGKNKILYKHEDFSFGGHMATEHLWRCIPATHIEDMNIEETVLSTMCLNIKTKLGINIYVEPVEMSVLFALHGMLDINEDIQFRILNSIYLGIKQCDIIAKMVGTDQSTLEPMFNQMIEREWIDPQNNMLSKGMDIIRNFIQRKSSARENKIANDDLELMEELRMNEARKSLIQKMEDFKKPFEHSDFLNSSGFAGEM